MRPTSLLGILAFSIASLSAQAAITFTGLTDKTKYNNTVTFTVVADPGAATTTATLDGAPIAVGTPITLTQVRYHEVAAESRTAGNVLADSKLIRFIVRDNAVRGDSESGIPQHTPYKSVQDAPSAFAGKTFKVIVPAAWPAGVPVPLAFKLVDGANETVRLNGIVAMSGFPATKVQMRRGWGSVTAPAVSTAGTVNVKAAVNGLFHNPAITIEAAPVFTTVSGTIAANATWPANSRIHVTGALTVNAGATLTVEQGAIVKVYTGTATNASAAEIIVNGTLQVNGVEGNPVAFIPDTVGGLWGGIELRATTSVVNANHTIFTGSGEDESWFTTNSASYASHQAEQALFLLSASGAGTSVGAQLHLNDCVSFDIGGQQFNSRTNTWVDLNRSLFQRCISCGELNNSKVTIDRCALIEFPSETGNFVDDDNDGIYLTGGDLSVTNTVIGYTKDDGIDSGGGGGASPFGTVDPISGTTTTRFVSTNNWYEGTYHEGNSLSGTRNVYFTGCVFLNCGQGVEAGYSNSDTSDGPHAKVDGCLFANNMVGVRWGDNYGNGYSYNAAFEVKNSLVLNSAYRDAFSGQWHPTQLNAWIYQTTNLNSFGNPYFNVHDNYLSQPDPVHHPLNTTWNPANPAHAALIEPFMPVPGSNVGVGISTYQALQSDTSAFAGTFTARLSTFSSKQVSVGWAVFGKTDPLAEAETSLASGTLTFQPGDTLETFTATVPTPGNYGLIRVALGNPVNAEVTGEQVYVKLPAAASPTLIGYGSTWKYLDNGTNQGTAWRNVGFDDSAWASGAGELGYGDSDETTVVQDNPTPGYVAGDTNRYATTYFRKTFTVADVAQLTTLSLSVRYDDGAVVYINGVRHAATAGMPIDPAHTYFTGGTAPPDNSVLASTTIPVSALVNGTNTIAVEIHQQSASSSDMSFDLKLDSNPTTPLTLNFGKTGGNPVLWWFGPNDLLEHSTDLINWFPAPVTGSPVTITPSGPKEFFRLKR